MANKDGRIRKNVLIGALVQIVLKIDQNHEKITKGTVAEILTAGAKHPQGIKVRLNSGQIGHIHKILSAKKKGKLKDEAEPPKRSALPWENF